MAENHYRVIEIKGWSYVVSNADDIPYQSGPWRYRWEAQEYADDLELRRRRAAEGDVS